MEFNPRNPIVQLCLQGMAMEEKGKPEEASKLFLQAWKEGTTDLDKFLAAHYIARHQNNVSDRLAWSKTALQFAQKIDSALIQSAFPALYENIGDCYQELKNPDKASEYYSLADSFRKQPADQGPFYHGTKADLPVGDLLTAGGNSNYQPELKMNHIYFTASVNVAGPAAALANGDGPARVYRVEPTGSFDHDPNVTDKKFPGNLTRSYRSEAPLKIVGEVTDWERLTTVEIQQWKEKLARNKGKIIN